MGLLYILHSGVIHGNKVARSLGIIRRALCRLGVILLRSEKRLSSGGRLRGGRLCAKALGKASGEKRQDPRHPLLYSPRRAFRALPALRLFQGTARPVLLRTDPINAACFVQNPIRQKEAFRLWYTQSSKEAFLLFANTPVNAHA